MKFCRNFDDLSIHTHVPLSLFRLPTFLSNSSSLCLFPTCDKDQWPAVATPGGQNYGIRGNP